MGTGSEPRQALNQWQTVADSVPVPFFHATEGTARFHATEGTARKRGQAPSAARVTTAIPTVDGASPHFRAPAFTV